MRAILMFIGRRLLAAALSVWGAVTLVWLALQTLGVPVTAFTGGNPTKEQLDEIISTLGYDRPWPEQYVSFLGALVTETFPDSLTYRQNAFSVLLSKTPATLFLIACAMAVGISVAVVLGYISVFAKFAAVRKVTDLIFGLIQAIPEFLLALLLMLFLSIQWRLLPLGGLDSFASIINPAIALGLLQASSSGRVLRTALEKESYSEYAVAALSTGRSTMSVRVRHILPNALLPMVSMVGVQLGKLLGGTVVIEQIFRLPGVGRLLMTGVIEQDYPLVLAGIIWTTLGFILISILVDIVYVLIDPRVGRE